jgi:TRAP-type mannitol/chloroaromatic compound transport system substrate-binding protein
VKHISAGGQDPCNFNTKNPINSLADLEGQALHLPDRRPLPGPVRRRAGDAALGGRRSRRADRRARRHAWSGITEDYTVGWADVTDYFLTNNISGAWIGSFFANRDRWNELPDHLKAALHGPAWKRHYLPPPVVLGRRSQVARHRHQAAADAPFPPAEWKQVEDAAKVFWDEIAAESETKAKVVSIFKEYNEVMQRPAALTATADPS